MYERYWGLRESPFTPHMDPRWFVETPAHEEALARLLFLAEEHRRCGILLGEHGTGKSLLLRVLETHFKRSGTQVVLVDLQGVTGSECLWQILASCGHPCAETSSAGWMWRRLRDHLQGSWSAKAPTLFLFDHLEHADADAIPVLRRLVHLTTAEFVGATTVISLNREYVPAHLSLLREISELRIELAPLGLRETRDYVTGLLNKAGCDRSIFTSETWETLQLQSGGIPREINRLCDLALLAGMSSNASAVSERQLNSAVEDHPLAGWDTTRHVFSTALPR